MPTHQPLHYATLDVFTTTPFTGNQLAIVHIPPTLKEPLSQATKQAIAREFNFSETVFLHPPDAAGEDSGGTRIAKEEGECSRLDIFTLSEELPFAGHPVIGAICHVGRSSNELRQSGVDYQISKNKDKLESSSSSTEAVYSVILKIKAGILRGRYDAGSGFAKAEIPHNVRVHGARVNAQRALALQQSGDGGVVIETKQDGRGGYPAVSIVKGLTFVLAELADLESLGALRPAAQKVDEWTVQLDDGWGPSLVALYYYVVLQRLSSGVTRIRSRMMEPNIGEDPCTGSAASTLAAYLSLQDGEAGKTYAYIVEQGVEMGRAGDIHVEVVLDGTGRVVQKVSLAGKAVLVTEGTLYLPEA